MSEAMALLEIKVLELVVFSVEGLRPPEMWTLLLVLCVLGLGVRQHLSSMREFLQAPEKSEGEARAPEEIEGLEGKAEALEEIEGFEKKVSFAGKAVRHVRVQAPDTYTFWHQQPRFKPLSAREQGAWPEAC